MSTALIIVDVQTDFLPGGALAVEGGDEILPELEKAVRELENKGDDYLIVASRDWHPRDHCSFVTNGGQWPVHCVAGTEGADLHALVEVFRPRKISKGRAANVEQYSAFDGTHLEIMLKAEGFTDLLIGGLATDYCVQATVLDALKLGFKVTVLANACRAVNVKPGDGEAALEKMERAGAKIRKD